MVTCTMKLIITSLALICLLHKGETAKRKRRSLALIVNGEEAAAGQFPFAVSLQSKLDPSEYKSKCALSLITKKTCLGAAHCIGARDTGEFTMHHPTEFCGILGINIYKYSECKGFSAIHWHRKYVANDLIHDIATFIFNEEAILSEDVKPIPLIGPNEKIPEGEITVMGWGTKYYGQEVNFPVILRYARVRILPISQCQTAKELERLCLETEGKGPCTGDSGGPNVISHLGEDILVGVTSFSEAKMNCAAGRTTATDIRGYAQWIIDHSDSKPSFVTMKA